MLFMQLGIYMDYWGDFSSNAWSVHIHYWTGTIWYVYLIIQPYYATHGFLDKHRTNGIIGMFIAGGVCLTAFSMMHRDIVTTERSLEFADSFGPFEPWFFFGVMAVEIPMIIAFGYAVIMSILKRKSLDDHAWWLVSTVFIIMMPALSRGVQNIYIMIHTDDWPNVDIMAPIYFSQFLIILLAVLASIKYKQLKHPATFLMVGINLYNCLLEPLGRSVFVQEMLKALVKG